MEWLWWDALHWIVELFLSANVSLPPPALMLNSGWVGCCCCMLPPCKSDSAVWIESIISPLFNHTAYNSSPFKSMSYIWLLETQLISRSIGWHLLALPLHRASSVCFLGSKALILWRQTEEPLCVCVCYLIRTVCIPAFSPEGGLVMVHPEWQKMSFDGVLHES